MTSLKQPIEKMAEGLKEIVEACAKRIAEVRVNSFLDGQLYAIGLVDIVDATNALKWAAEKDYNLSVDELEKLVEDTRVKATKVYNEVIKIESRYTLEESSKRANLLKEQFDKQDAIVCEHLAYLKPSEE